MLALLVLHANQVVPSERVLVELWGEDAPPGAANALQAAVSRLRRALPEDRLVTRPPGYLFRAFPDEVDLSRFERLLAQGRQALADGAAAEAAGTLAEALRLWRGPALADFRYEPFAQAEIARLDELRLGLLSPEVEFRFLLVQGDVVVQGRGRGTASFWSGKTLLDQPPLQEGDALAIGLLVVARRDPAGYETFSWADRIRLAP